MLLPLISLLFSLIPLLISLSLLLILRSLLWIPDEMLTAVVPLHRHLRLLRHVRIVSRFVGIILLPLLPQILLLRLRPIRIPISSFSSKLSALDRLRESSRGRLSVSDVSEMDWSSDDGSERSRKRSGIRALSASELLTRIVRRSLLVRSRLLRVLLRIFRVGGGLRLMMLRLLRGLLLMMLGLSRILLRALTRIGIRGLAMLSLHRSILLLASGGISSLRQHHVRRLRSREFLVQSVQLVCETTDQDSSEEMTTRTKGEV